MSNDWILSYATSAKYRRAAQTHNDSLLAEGLIGAMRYEPFISINI